MLIPSLEDEFMQSTPLAEYRCACGKLLFKGVVRTTQIQIKCKRCSALSSFGPSDARTLSGRYGVLTAEDGTILSVSDSITKILGYTPEELCSLNLHDLRSYDQGSAGREMPSYGSVVETHRGKDGRSVSVRVRHEPAGMSPAAILYTCDIQPPAVLNDAPNDFIAHELYLEVDTALRCRYASYGVTKLLGIPAYSLVGASLETLLEQGSVRRCRSLTRIDHTVYSPRFLEDVRLHGVTKRTFRIHAVPAWRDDGVLGGYTLLLEEDTGSA